MKLEKIQFITHYNSKYDYLTSAHLALSGGVRLIQLRMKREDRAEIRNTAMELKKMCRDYGAKLIIDDYVDLAYELDLDGVHLGLMDMPIDRARARLGKEKIIGGTANTYEDLLMQYNRGADYIGVGPYRHTTTKEVISNILGFEGYEKIIENCKRDNINIPIYAIGGIRTEDLEELKRRGVYGIALSSLIIESSAPIETSKEIIRIFN